MRWRPFVAGFLAVVALAACTSKKTIVTNEGTTTVETNRLRQTVKVSSRAGTAIIGRNAVNPNELGLPLYPRAIVSQTGGLTTHSREGTSYIVSLNTKDSFEQAYQWYKQRLPTGSEQAHLDVAGGSVASFLLGKPSDADQKSVVITHSKDTTTILLTHISKNT